MLYYLILILYGGGIQNNPAMVLIPTPMSYETCKVRGEAWIKDYDGDAKASWQCVKVD